MVAPCRRSRTANRCAQSGLICAGPLRAASSIDAVGARTTGMNNQAMAEYYRSEIFVPISQPAGRKFDTPALHVEGAVAWAMIDAFKPALACRGIPPPWVVTGSPTLHRRTKLPPPSPKHHDCGHHFQR